MTRIFRYILKTDSGIAPCIDGGLVSLATCKPKVRASARPGDWVVGFYPRPAPRGIVAWAGRIADRLDVGEYEIKHRGRADAVYRAKPDGTFKRLRPDYHPGANEIRKDLSGPALIFDPAATWYFGGEPKMLPERLIGIAAKGQGHRVNGTTVDDLRELLEWLQGLAAPGIHGAPRHPITQLATPKRC